MLSSVLTTWAPFTERSKGWFMSDLFGLLTPRYVSLSFGMVLIVLAVVYT